MYTARHPIIPEPAGPRITRNRVFNGHPPIWQVGTVVAARQPTASPAAAEEDPLSEPRHAAITLRAAMREDAPFLWEMLTLAAHMQAETAEAVAEAQQHPFLAKFVRDWGGPGDLGVLALAAAQPVGAAWLRHLVGPEQSYPAVDPAFPELAVAVRAEHTGRGVGGALLSRLVEQARPHYPGLVLSVRADNPARRLYERHGFVVVDEIVNRVGTRSYVMELRLAR